MIDDTASGRHPISFPQTGAVSPSYLPFFFRSAIHFLATMLHSCHLSSPFNVCGPCLILASLTRPLISSSPQDHSPPTTTLVVSVLAQHFRVFSVIYREQQALVSSIK